MPNVGETMKPLVRMGRKPEDCWEWLSVKTEAGYGKKTLGGKTLLAHRWMWTQLFGLIPEGLVIDHTCANPGCVNPSHLRVVTQAENCRSGAGATLTPLDVLEIKRAKKSTGLGVAAALADRFGVSRQLIHDIWGKRAWSGSKPFYGAKKFAPPKSLNKSEQATP